MRMVWLVSFITFLSFQFSCNEETSEVEVIDEEPVINIVSPLGFNATVTGETEVNIEIVFSDDIGLSSFSVVSPPLQLASQADLQGVVSYTFQQAMAITASAGSFSIAISATDTKGQEVESTLVINKVEDKVVMVTIDPSETYQTIRNFGASDAWSTQFVGKNWPSEKKDKMADLLFSSTKDASGNPTGIGLSAWRFNIGGGSAEQGDANNITDEWRRAESFLSQDGSYDWDKQEGQLWFLKKAVEYGIEDLVAFVNSPPVNFTKNGRAFSDNGNSSNLKQDSYNEYAVFLSTVLNELKKQHNINIKDISPVNEPQWEWECCNQEGSPWNNTEIYQLLTVLNEEFIKSGVTAKIDITEAGSMEFLYGSGSNAQRGNQIDYFFSPSSAGYVADLPTVANHISGHSYFTTFDVQNMRNVRSSLSSKLSAINQNTEFWMSEYTLLENNEEINGNGRDLGMNPALYMARVIHADLVYANAAVWHWWLAVSPYDYKDGLIYIDKNKNDGQYYTSKLLWGLGNYSHFIRPGSKRIAIKRNDEVSEVDNLNGLMQSAYLVDGEIVVVFVNQKNESAEVKFEITSGAYDTVEMYQTSSSRDLSLVRTYTKDEPVIIGGRSIVTCVLK
ncbi:MAG: glycoside hydrolase [Cyclobacteriaceae bacterium]